MKTRRIVTGHSPAGRSVLISDGFSPWIADATHIPWLRAELLWRTGNSLKASSSATADPVTDATSLVPVPHGTSMQVVTFPPDAMPVTPPDATPAELAADQARVFPGLVERFESENPGMHVTDTVDYCILLEGELVMELDDGVTTVVRKNDVVIQNGTRHGWRNHSDQPATMLFMMIGMPR